MLLKNSQVYVRVFNWTDVTIDILMNREDLIYFQLHTAAFKAYCATWVRRSNFHHQASPRESTQRRKVEL
jgi:hypothetical protein